MNTTHDDLYIAGVALVRPYLLLVDAVPSPADSEAGRADLAAGIKKLRAAIELRPENWSAFWLLGKACECAGRFANGLVHIRAKNGWRPKTVAWRAVPMTPPLRQALEALPRRSRWVLTSPRSNKYPQGDNQVSERRLLVYLKKLLAKLGLRGHLHSFRHSFISHALTLGTPEAVVRSWVGHVDAEILRQYTHIADTASKEAMQRLAEQTDRARRERQEVARKEAARNGDGVSAQSQHNNQETKDEESAK